MTERPLTPALFPEYGGEGAMTERPLTPALSPEYGGEGAMEYSLSR